MDERQFYNIKRLILSDSNYSQEIIKLDLDTFPVIDDFEIKTIETGSLGVHIYFYSLKLGILSSFPWWDHAEHDIKKMSIEHIPLGSTENIYDDLEQGWQILIWEEKEYIYIMEGDEPCCQEFRTWFKVNKNNYILEWQKLIDLFNN